MARVLKDRVKETTTTTGTGTVTLAGAVSGYQSFSVIGNANTTYYTIVGTTEWEVGLGTYTTAGTTLSRDTIYESSNAGAAVNFSAGSKDVFCTYPAERAVVTEASGIINSTGDYTVRAASTANFANTGPTATVLTASAVGITTIDGVALVLNDIVLLLEQTLPAQDGVYKVTTEGTAGVAAVLTRVDELNTWAEITSASRVSVIEGTFNFSSVWICKSQPGGTLGTSNINFEVVRHPAIELFVNSSSSILVLGTASGAFLHSITGDAAGITYSTSGSLPNIFSTDVTVPDEVYGAGWNASLEVPTKNAVYDEMELRAPKASPTFTGTITAATITASGAVTGSNLSNTNTGDDPVAKLATTANFANTTPTATVLTASAVGITTFDGTALVLNDVVLLKDQTLPAENGVYSVTTEGTAGVATVLTRVAAQNTWVEVANSPKVAVQQGTANVDTVWLCTSNTGGTLGTTSIDFKKVLTSTDVATVATSASATDLTAGTLPAARMPALTGDITTTVGTVATAIGANKVTNAMIRQSAGLSVVARSANTTGDVADITAVTDGHVLRLSGTTLGFGTIATAGITDDAVTYAKIQNVSVTDRLLGRDTAAAGDVEELTATGGIEFTGTGIQTSAFTGNVTKAAGGTVTTIPANTVTLAMQADMATSSLVYRKTAAAGAPEVNTLATLKTDLGLTGTNSGDQTITLTGDVTGSGVGSFAATLAANQKLRTITFIIDGAGATITTGVKGYLEIPFACTIQGWTALANASGSIVVDVWKDTYANFPPLVADTIAGSEKPTITTATKGQDLALTTWTTAIAAGDILAFNVDSATTVQRVTVSIKVSVT